MQFYLAALDDLVRLPNENTSIGIFLFKTKDWIRHTLKEWLF
jgi:hypothetical protein